MPMDDLDLWKYGSTVRGNDDPALPNRSNASSGLGVNESRAGSNIPSTGIDLSLVMNRMGHILLGAKDIFDKRSVNGKLSMEGCIGKLL